MSKTYFYRISRSAPPASEPVTLEGVKEHLRITSSSEDSYLTNLIKAVRADAEMYTNRVFIERAFIMFLDHWPYQKNMVPSGYFQLPVNYFDSPFDYIELPKSPLASVTSIKTYADDGSPTVFDESNYSVSVYDGDNPPRGRISLRLGKTWPTYTRLTDGIEISFLAGYSGTESGIPDFIKQALYEEIAYRYENRGDCPQTINSVSGRGMLDMIREVTL